MKDRTEWFEPNDLSVPSRYKPDWEAKLDSYWLMLERLEENEKHLLTVTDQILGRIETFGLVATEIRKILNERKSYAISDSSYSDLIELH